MPCKTPLNVRDWPCPDLLNLRFCDAVGLRSFILPLIAIRNRKKGYAVSIIKAGMKVIGRDSGPVRPPLTDLTEQEIAELAALVKKLPAARSSQQAAE